MMRIFISFYPGGLTMAVNIIVLFLILGAVYIVTASDASAAPSQKYCSSHKDSYSAFGIECSGLWQFDVDGDQKVSEPEMYNGFKSVFPDPEYVAAYFLFRDLNTDGAFDRHDEPLLFDRMDLDKNGDVTLGEYFTEYQFVRAGVPFVIMSQGPYIQNGANVSLLRNLDRQGLEHVLENYMPHSANGSVEKTDFVDIYLSKFMKSRQEAEFYFGQFNANDDDVITTSEMGGVFDDRDKNGDGILELTEIMEIGRVHDKYLPQGGR